MLGNIFKLFREPAIKEKAVEQEKKQPLLEFASPNKAYGYICYQMKLQMKQTIEDGEIPLEEVKYPKGSYARRYMHICYMMFKKKIDYKTYIQRYEPNRRNDRWHPSDWYFDIKKAGRTEDGMLSKYVISWPTRPLIDALYLLNDYVAHFEKDIDQHPEWVPQLEVYKEMLKNVLWDIK